MRKTIIICLFNTKNQTKNYCANGKTQIKIGEDTYELPYSAGTNCTIKKCFKNLGYRTARLWWLWWVGMQGSPLLSDASWNWSNSLFAPWYSDVSSPVAGTPALGKKKLGSWVKSENKIRHVDFVKVYQKKNRPPRCVGAVSY